MRTFRATSPPAGLKALRRALFPCALGAAMVGVAFRSKHRRRREQALRTVTRRLSRAEARQRDLIELAPDAFFLSDLEGRFTNVNQAACRMLGFSREALLGKRIRDVIPQEDLVRLASARAALLVPGHVDRSEWRLVRSDGVVLPVEISAKILSGGRWQAFVRDISERKQVEEALRISEEEQRFLAEAGAELGASLDFEQTLATLGELMVRALADWCIVDVVEGDRGPRRLKVVSARSGQTVLADKLERLRIDRRRPYLSRPVFESGEPFVIERVTSEMLLSLSQSDEHLELLRALEARSIMGVPLTVGGELRGVLVLISSTRRYGPPDLRLAQGLADRAALAIENGRLYQTAVNATQFRDEVLGVVAHDLRSPVAAITLQAAALRRRAPAPERRSQKPAETILRAATRMNRLIGDLLDVTLIESGQLGVDRGRVPARSLVSEAVEAQRPVAASKGLELRLELAADLPDLWGDAHRLLQVLENLIGNSIKFTPSDGRITVGARPRGREVLLWVADTGVGIAAEGLPHVFDRFWQAQKSHRGAGLGLPIARGIVEAHGGHIWVDSALGRGTTVSFTVPEAA